MLRWGAVFDFADPFLRKWLWHWPAFNADSWGPVPGVGPMLIRSCCSARSSALPDTAMTRRREATPRKDDETERTTRQPGSLPWPSSWSWPADRAAAACSTISAAARRCRPTNTEIVSHSPLTMPPNAELRPPRPGEPRPQETSTADQAREALSPTLAARAMWRPTPKCRRSGDASEQAPGRQGRRRRYRSQRSAPAGQSRHAR